MIAKKFILSILLCAGIIGTGSPMKRARDESDKPCPHNEIVLSENNEIVLNNDRIVRHNIEFDFSPFLLLNEQGWSYNDIFRLIVLQIRQLDDKSFLAFGATCKKIYLICDAILTKDLKLTTFADAVCNNKMLFTRRFLTKTNDPTLNIPTVIQNLCSRESAAGKIELCKVLIGTQPVYKITCQRNDFNDACTYSAFIDMGNQNFVHLKLVTKQALKAMTLSSEEDKDALEEALFVDLNNRGFSKPDIDYLSAASGLLFYNVRRNYLQQQDENELLIMIFSPRGKNLTSGVIELPKGPDEISVMFLNLQIIFIIAARKNYAAMIDLFLKKFRHGLTPFSLRTADELTTDPTIKEAIKKELESRENRAQ